MKVQLAVVSFCVFVNFIEAINKRELLEIDNNVDIYQKYIDLDKQFKGLAESAVKKMFPYVLEASEHVNISTTCMDNLFQFMLDFRKLSEWTLRFLDATGKPPSGIMSGNIQMFGEYNQCLDTIVKRKGKFQFRGQYCTVILKPVLPNGELQLEKLSNILQNSTGLMKFLISKLYVFFPLDPRLGMCAPSGCTKEDMSQMLNYITQNVFLNTSVYNCIKKEDLYYWTSDKIVSVCVFGVLGILLIVCTILDNTMKEWKENSSGTLPRIIESFSITHNFPKLINTDISEDTVTCFYGIRVLSIFWIVLCHEYVLQATGLTSNHTMNIEDFVHSFFSQIVLNGFTATEIFFFLGGFVNIYTRVKLQKCQKAQPHVFQIIVHRLLRIYPTLIVTFLTVILLNQSGAPYYEYQYRVTSNCRKYWWQNLLFINNFFKPLDVCLPHTWYLCVDMQMFLLSLITIPVLLRKEKIGIYLHIGIVFLANIGCFIFWWIQALPPSPGIFPLKEVLNLNVSYFEFQASIYMLPFLHVASYYIGILIGYVVASKDEKKFSKMTNVLGWLAASSLYITVIFMTYRWNSGTPYTKLESCLFASLSKSTLVLCVSWMVYVCLTGQAKVINYILSLKIWIPLSRLTFMLYMVSIVVQGYYNSNLNFPPDFASIFLIWSYFGNLSISLLLSLALVLLAESPMLSLQKISFRRNGVKDSATPKVHKEITVNGIKENDVKKSSTPEIYKAMTLTGIKENGVKDNQNIITVHL